jgi:hypothetical protein
LLAKTDELVERERTTYLNTIGGLLGLLIDPAVREARSPLLYKTQDQVIFALKKTYEAHAGIKNSTLEKTFAAAKKSIDNP